MNILYVSQFFYPELNAGAYRAYEQSYYWKKEGHHITVITTYPNYPRGTIYKGYHNKIYTREKINGIDVHRVKSIIRKNTNKKNRLVLYISFVFFAFLNTIIGNIKVKNNDVIIGTSGPIFTPVYAHIISRIKGIPFVLELRDITYIQLLGTQEKRTIYYTILKKIEIYLCTKASQIIVTTEKFKQLLIEHGVLAEKINVLPNGVIINKDIFTTSKNKKINKTKNEIKFCYAGTFGISQDLTALVAYFDALELPNKKLYLIGDGAEKQKIYTYIQKNKIENVKVLDPMAQEELHAFYKEVDICVVKLKNSPQFSSFIPSKLFDIMNHQKPVLYLGPKGEVTDIIDKSQCGIYYHYESQNKNAIAFSNYIKSYKSTAALKLALSKMGQNGQIYCNHHHDREKIAKEYLNILNKIIYDG